MSQKGRSGACNVCAAPCSSCMHFEDMEFSGDTSVLDETSNITTTTTTKPENSAVMMDGTDESDIIEHDVKVCDICGDAGREDMLAICSRCTDGAEHTYCMRKMLRKVPANHWMCEECKFADDINNTHNKPGVEGKRLTKSGSSTHFSNKRLAENAQVAPAPKRQALESPKSSSPVKSISLSRDSSFKNSDKDRLRPPQQPNQDTAHSPSAASRLQTRKGLLVKSKSFNASNSKPKVKLVDEVLPPKQMGGKDCTSVDAKERSRMLQKSMSLKSPNLGRPSASDSKVKMLSPRTSHALDSKGSRSLKERHAFDRKNLLKSDRPLNSSTSSSTVSTQKPDLPRSESSLPSFSSNTRDLKVQTEGKSTTSKATGTSRPVEVPITSVGVSSATELKFKEDTSFTSEKPTSSNTVDGTTPEGLPRSQETSMRPRSIVMPNSKSTFCQKCKEIGHSAEFCSSNSLEASGTDTSAPTARSSREEIHGDSKLKEAIHAALLRKPEIQRKKRILDQVDDISTSSTDLNSEMACHDQVAVSNKSKVPLSGEGTHEAPQAILRNPTCDSTHSVPITDAKSYIINPVVKDLTSHSLATSPQLAKMLAIPEYDYIWRGCFEVNRSGSFLELCEGIQAHLSSCVSPRIPEVARKFPQKLSLNEVPRLSAWPTQFYDGGAKEDNIALYFFAKDLESYERNYKSLLDGMIKNDLALKGNFEGVELLIFPSNQLPENSQRWNMLYFLWGVFRARRVHDSESSDKSNVPNDRTVLVDKKAANDVTAVSENVCSPKFIDANSSGCPEISGDFSDQKFSVPISSGLTASAVLQDTKCLSDPNLSDSLRCSGPSVRDKSPPDVRVQAAELKASSMGGGVNSCNVVEKAQLYCDSELKKDVDGVGIVCEKKVLEGFSGENDSEMKDVKSVDVCVGKKRKRMFFLGESNSIAKGLLVEKKVCVEEKCEEKVIPEDLSATERRFFPVEDSCGGWKSSCQDQGLGFPNLELALGAETKPHQNKGMLPFLVDKKLNDYDRDEDVSASLSLSLSFPMNKEHQPPKQQQQQQEVSKQRVNTSLLLFGGFPDK